MANSASTSKQLHPPLPAVEPRVGDWLSAKSTDALGLTQKDLKGGNKKVATENGLLQKGWKGGTKKVATENLIYRLCMHDI